LKRRVAVDTSSLLMQFFARSTVSIFGVPGRPDSERRSWLIF
jgi:hypothetical protein